MGFHDDLAAVAFDPAIMRLAGRRAGSRELGQDAVQATFLAVSQVKDPERIVDLRAFFTTSLIREINHQRARPGFIPVEDIASAGEQGDSSPGPSLPESVEHEAEIRRLAQTVLNQLNADSELAATVPGRSADPQQYRVAIIAAASAIFLMLLQSMVASADWNAVLRSTFAGWFAEAGLTAEAADQRLSRGRYDVRCVLGKLVVRDELG